jgi:hypothetical protein
MDTFQDLINKTVQHLRHKVLEYAKEYPFPDKHSILLS